MEPNWLSKFDAAEKKGNGWECRCPVHEDSKNSLSVYQKDGQWQVYCHAGCKTGDVLKAVGLTAGGLNGKVRPAQGAKKQIVAEYNYTDESGNLLFQAVRFEPKDFRQRRPVGNGWEWNLKGVRLVPYNLQAVMQADAVFVVEGEKDVESLRRAGHVATCNPMGAGKWRKEFSGYLAGKTVYIIPDNDEPGRKHAGQVYAAVKAVARSVQVIDLPTGKDMTDYLAAGGTVAGLLVPAATTTAKPAAATTANLRDLYNPYRDTHLGNADRLIGAAGGDIRYSDHAGWYAWTGSAWEQGDAAIQEIYKKTVVPGVYQEVSQAALSHDQDGTKRLINWAKRSESAGVMRETISMAATADSIKIDASEFDADGMLLNCKNGTLDLRTGALRAHRREDFITRAVFIEYDPAAKCPRWEQFLEELFPAGRELIDWLQRAVGYCLTGSVVEQVMFFCTGTGRNGKSVFMNTVMALLGNYACETPTETLMARHGAQQAIANDLARLPGIRMVSANETEHGERLAEAKIKGMTGGDLIAARFLHKEYFEFRPVFKLWLRSNHKPVIKGTDEGIWRRIRLIPFAQNFEGREDRALQEKLYAELPGILNWALTGCVAWQAIGLEMPETVQVATQQYRSSQDTIGLFLQEKTMSGVEWIAHNTRASDLYKSYTDWCEEAGERPVSQRRLANILLERGFDRFLGGAEWSYRWIGLVLKTSNNM